MRWTKLALLIFGGGLLLGLVVVVAGIDSLARVASLLMALGIVGIPFGGLLDWRRAARPAASTGGRRNRARGRVGRNVRPRKPAPKR